jgi:hypothetical protein
MKAMARLAATAALVALAGCNPLGFGGGSGNVSANANAAAGNAAAGSGGKDGGGSASADGGSGSASAPVAGAGLGGKDGDGTVTQASAGGAPVLDRAFVTGRWTDKGDCSDAVEFSNDGRFFSANGAGLWNLEGDELTMSGNAQTITMRIVPIDRNTMTVINQGAAPGRSTRC